MDSEYETALVFIPPLIRTLSIGAYPSILVDNQTALGKTLLPQTITSLFKAALAGSPIPDDARTGVVSEILRVAANLCMDHGESLVPLIVASPDPLRPVQMKTVHSC
jgi:hypothetical protein